ncbi:MAG TPA: HD domain-containing protein [bacterium]|nr:HD domain-containing protein [bacterium]HPQ66859.1 HD domain-containing protein [bacterium]
MIAFPSPGRAAEHCRSWLEDYLMRFPGDDDDQRRNFAVKRGHTYRVRAEIMALGRNLGLVASAMELAEILALVHDVGRFEQYARFRTFVDRRSLDHAALGADILRSSPALDPLPPRLRELVLRCVSYHNRAELPAGEGRECLYFTRLLRDADKLDIWRVVTDYYRAGPGERNPALELELPDTPGFSDEVCRSLLEERMVDSGLLANLNDFKLLQAGWVYGINFTPSLRAVRERGYLESIRAALPPSPRLDRIFGRLRSRLEVPAADGAAPRL